MTEATTGARPLTAYRVHLDTGETYVTSMAAGVTLDEARSYFIGNALLHSDESPRGTVVDVTDAAGDAQ